MKKNLIVLVVMMMWCSGVLLSQETWVRTFGGSEHERGSSVTSTPDGGYILTGSTSSNDGDFKGINKGGSDIFVIKLNSLGQIQWKKIVGGSGTDVGTSITTTSDGGYVLSGVTYNYYNDGDLIGMRKGDKDVFVIKLDQRGDITWRRTFCGRKSGGDDESPTISDGGHILIGSTNCEGDDFDLDIFMVKLDSQGDITWKRSFGGNGEDRGNSVTPTSTGGYYVTGWSKSDNIDLVEVNKGRDDIVVQKVEPSGRIQWMKVLGGSGDDWGNSITTTRDQGVVVTGSTTSNDGDFHEMNRGWWDIFVVKYDSLGDIRWKKTFGGPHTDMCNSIDTTIDGGYVLTGYSETREGDIEGLNKGYPDVLVIKLDSLGDIQWKKTYGGSQWDEGHSITSSSDGGYVLTGYTHSTDGDFKGMNKGRSDIFVMKLDSNGNLQPKGKKSKK